MCFKRMNASLENSSDDLKNKNHMHFRVEWSCQKLLIDESDGLTSVTQRLSVIFWPNIISVLKLQNLWESWFWSGKNIECFTKQRSLLTLTFCRKLGDPVRWGRMCTQVISSLMLRTRDSVNQYIFFSPLVLEMYNKGDSICCSFLNVLAQFLFLTRGGGTHGDSKI